MADDKSFKELIREQKKTNKLLESQAKGDERGANLKASIRNAAGEIVTELLVSSRQAGEHDQTQEQIEKSRKVRDTIATKEKVDEDIRSDAIISAIEDLETVISNTLEISQEEKDDDAGNENRAALKEEKKDEKKSLSLAITKALGKGLKVAFKGLLTGLKKLNPLKGGVGTFLKGLFGLAIGGAALIGLKNFLNSPEWEDIQENILPRLEKGLRAVVGIMKNIGNRLLNLAVDIADPDKSTKDTILDNATTIAGIVAVLYGGTIISIGASITKAVALGAASLLPAGVLSTVIASLFAALGAFAIIAVGAFAVFKGVEAGIDKFKETDSISLAIREGLKVFIANLVGIIPDLILDVIGFFVGLVAPELGKKIQDISVVAMIDTALEDLTTIIHENLPKLFKKITGGLNAFFHRATGGIFLGDEKKTQAKMMDDMKKLKVLKDQEDIAKNMTPLAQAKHAANIKFLEESIAKSAKSIERIKEFEKGMEIQRNMPDGHIYDDKNGELPSYMGYSGGLARAGESIMVGELGPELMIPKTDSQIFSARKSEELIMTALSRGVQASSNSLPRGSNGNLNLNQNNSGGGGTTINDNKIVNAPSSSVSTHTNVIRTVVEPDVYFQRQSGWAI